MNDRKTGKYGTIIVAKDEGVPRMNVVLSQVAEKEISGELFVNRLLQVPGGAFINMAKEKTARISGIYGSAFVLPDSAGANNKVLVSAIRAFKHTGELLSLITQTLLTLTRPGVGEKCWAAIVADFSSTLTVTAVYGTPITGDLLEAFGPEAGKLPYLGEEQFLITAVQLDDVAAPVLEENIVTRFSDGTVLQERTDVPKYDWMPLEGGILTLDPLLACHTGGTARKAALSFYDQKNSMIEAGHTTKWNLSINNPTVDFPAQNDVGPQSALSGPGTWTGGFGRYAVDELDFDLAQKVKMVVVRLYRDRKDLTRYYEGVALVVDWGEECDQGSAIMSSLSFKGNSNLELRRPL